jgi:hypothetical protein
MPLGGLDSCSHKSCVWNQAPSTIPVLEFGLCMDEHTKCPKPELEARIALPDGEVSIDRSRHLHCTKWSRDFFLID